MKMNYNAITVFGPTATGKTDFSIKIAKELKKSGIKSEIINFDSLLFYKELNIGTAKPSIQERKEVAHHLIDIRSYKKPINCSEYIKIASPLIPDFEIPNKNEAKATAKK